MHRVLFLRLKYLSDSIWYLTTEYVMFKEKVFSVKTDNLPEISHIIKYIINKIVQRRTVLQKKQIL